MPLYGDRLFASDTWLMAGPEGRCAAMMLWWESWKQCPAGSLADHDRVLAQLAGYGMAIKGWLNVKEEAMRGWVKCNDGRIYHPVVCSLAMEAWDRRVKERDRKASYRAKREGQDGAVPRDRTRTETGQDADKDGDGHVERKRQDRTGQDRIFKKEERTVLRTSAGSAVKEPDARDRLWGIGLPSLQAMTGLPARRARAALGKLLKDARDDCALVLTVLDEAATVRPIDPYPWLQKAILARSDRREGAAERIARDLGFSFDDLEEGHSNGTARPENGGNYLAHDAETCDPVDV